MLNTPLTNPQTISSTDTQRHFSTTHSQAEKIVNIAGIGNGDSVFYSGIPDRTIQAAVTGLGARFVGGRTKFWPVSARFSADVALWSVSDRGPLQMVQSLRIARRYLRPGGRIVAWVIPDGHHRASSLRDRFQDLAGSAGFTSVIVGRLPLEAGVEMVVATGIVNR